MFKLSKPQMDVEEILDDCISEMREGERKKHIEDSKNEIVKKSKKYDNLAESGQLNEIEMDDQSKAIKDDFIYLYSGVLSRKGKKARKYYDELILLPKHGKCPFCCQRLVNTLDHYLPKSKYPKLSIVPYNLIPVCTNCNKNKSDSVSLDKKEMLIHPYYDDFDDEVWIKALVIESDPIAFEFYTEKPENWDEEKYTRAKKHFETFQLNDLYKPYAAEAFVTEIKQIERLYKNTSEEYTKNEIYERMQDCRKERKNDWRAAVYEAIYLNDWFWKKYIV